MAEQNTTSGVTAGDSGMPGSYTGTESSLSNWAGDYVTDMLGQGQALANEGYNAYTGPLTAGSSELQDQAFQGIAGIDLSLDQMGTGGYTPQAFTGENVNEYGFTGLNALSDAGATQRGITGEGIAADKAQFEEERDFPYKQVQYMQSLLQGLPIEAQSYNYAQPSVLSELASTSGGLSALYDKLFPNESKTAPSLDTMDAMGE